MVLLSPRVIVMLAGGRGAAGFLVRPQSGRATDDGECQKIIALMA
jgi:hypothetical protein